MKYFILCCMLVMSVYARDDSLMYKNIEFYENINFSFTEWDIVVDGGTNDGTSDGGILKKYSIFDSGDVEKYGTIKTLYLRAYKDTDVSKEQAAIENQNLQKIIPSYIKDVYPHKITFLTLFEPINKPYIYKIVKGFLYITEKPCGTHSFTFDCSSVDYSIAFYVTYDDEMQVISADKGFLTQQINAGLNYILPKEYNKIEAIYPNIKEQLQDKSYLILPIKIQIRTAASIKSPNSSNIDIITISTILKPNPQENREILSHYKDICKDYTPRYHRYNPYCSNGDRIYTYSKDMYVNVRKEANAKSEIIKQIATIYPKDFSDWDTNDYGLEDKYKPQWSNKKQEFLNKNPQIEDIELIYTKGLPVNNWYKVYFTDKKGEKIEGYIHRSELSWGF